MDYERFLEEVRFAVQEKLGDGHEISVQKVTKNNGIVLDGLVISSKDKKFAPTIYLNSYYMCVTLGKPLPEILDEIIAGYEENKDIAFENMEKFLNFDNLKDKIVYKLVQKEWNREFLEDIPSFEFLDLAVVFYLILERNRKGQMTALIHNAHMTTWAVTKEELYQLAKENTPKLLPPVIRGLKDVMREIMRRSLDGPFEKELPEDFLDNSSLMPPLYVLTNQTQINGASCILYDNCLAEFAAEQDSDIIIIPSSIHETLLVPDQGLDYNELLTMVIDVNKTEVLEEEVLANSVYKYEREEGKITVLRQAKS